MYVTLQLVQYLLPFLILLLLFLAFNSHNFKTLIQNSLN